MTWSKAQEDLETTVVAKNPVNQFKIHGWLTFVNKKPIKLDLKYSSSLLYDVQPAET